MLKIKRILSILLGSSSFSAVAADEVFSTETKGLRSVRKTEVVRLKDGDSYTLTATVVKQKIGQHVVRRYAYNGTIPGPTFEIPLNATVKVLFINQTDTEQTLHSHGLRLDYRYDGVAGLGQKTTVKPGESFTYVLRFPDSGVFWYHPHTREDYSQDMGLYGNYIVDEPVRTEAQKKSSLFLSRAPVNMAIPLVLDDVLLGAEAAPFYKDYANYAAMGRYGNVMLLNGSDHLSLQASEGDVVRFYLTNAANTRTFRFHIPKVKMKLVAADASPFEREEWVDGGVVIAPSERYTVDVLFPYAGEYVMENALPQGNIPLGRVQVAHKTSLVSYKAEFLRLGKNQAISDEIQKLAPLFQKPVDKKLALSVKMDTADDGQEHAAHSAHGELQKIEWTDPMPEMGPHMTSKNVTWELVDLQTAKKNMDILWTFKKGEYYKISIFNDPHSAHPMQHPIHFHGQRFLVLSVDGKENKNKAWKDTVLVDAGTVTEILLEASNPGQWMAHCHIAEHLSSGMMLGFQVIP